MNTLPLSGLKVLDLSRLLPGPYATLVLADLGATVDKVEDPHGGDYIRQMPPLRDDESALYYGLNRNKRSLTLDLKSPEGREALKRLARSYDVLVESFRPGVMDKLGVGWSVLHEENPRLIYCAISGYGQTGPDRLKAGHDINYAARAGVLAYGGEAGGAPAFPGVQLGDIGGGSLFALVGILAALHERERTGQGRFVDVSMTDGAMAFTWRPGWRWASRASRCAAAARRSTAATLATASIAPGTIATCRWARWSPSSSPGCARCWDGRTCSRTPTTRARPARGRRRSSRASSPSTPWRIGRSASRGRISAWSRCSRGTRCWTIHNSARVDCSWSPKTPNVGER